MLQSQFVSLSLSPGELWARATGTLCKSIAAGLQLQEASIELEKLQTAVAVAAECPQN